MKESTFISIVTAFITALTDYSTDQRGDVGSWIRIAGLQALGQVLPMDTKLKAPRVTEEIFEQVIRGIVKQAVEKLEPVREAAALALADLREADAERIWDWETSQALTFKPGDSGSVCLPR